MTVMEIVEQAKKLTPQEREDLLIQLQALLTDAPSSSIPKTGAEIVAWLEAVEAPLDLLVDEHIEDPTEWVKAQRQKRQLKIWGEDG